MKRLFVVAMLVLGFAGCESYNDPAVLSRNQTTVSGAGEEVGTLPDGRKLVRYRIDMGDKHDHWIYVTDGTITINHSESHGKTTNNHVEVIVDGVIYRPAAEVDR